MLSNTCKTAVKAVIFLATKIESGDKAAVKEIAEYIGASEHAVGKLLQTLVKQGVINSTQRAVWWLLSLRQTESAAHYQYCKSN